MIFLDNSFFVTKSFYKLISTCAAYEFANISTQKKRLNEEQHCVIMVCLMKNKLNKALFII